MIKPYKNPSIDTAILKVVCLYSGYSPETLISGIRKRRRAYWRYIGMYAAKCVFSFSLRDVSEMFGYNNHYAAMYAERIVNKHLKSKNTQVAADLKKVTDALKHLKSDLDNQTIDHNNLTYNAIAAENVWLYEQLSQANRKLSSNHTQKLEKAKAPDWERLSKQGESIGSDAVIQAFKAWYDSNEGKVVPARLRK